MKSKIRLWLMPIAIKLTDWLIANRDRWTDNQEEVNEVIAERNKLMRTKTYKKLNKKPSK